MGGDEYNSNVIPVTNAFNDNFTAGNRYGQPSDFNQQKDVIKEAASKEESKGSANTTLSPDRKGEASKAVFGAKDKKKNVFNPFPKKTGTNKSSISNDTTPLGGGGFNA